jgi:hypothetical protein
MEEKKQSSDAFGLIYHRYIKDDPARVSSFQEEPTKAAIARHDGIDHRRHRGSGL